MASVKVKILVVFYSMYGNMAKLAKAAAEGVNEVEGATAIVKQVPELIPKETIEANPRLKAVKESLKDIPFATADDLAEADGVIFGTPTKGSGTCVHR